MNQSTKKFKEMGEPAEFWLTFDGACYSGEGPYPINVGYEIQRKRLNPVDLMAEYWAATQISTWKPNNRGWYTVVRATRDQRATLLRFAQLPHYNEAEDWEEPIVPEYDYRKR